MTDSFLLALQAPSGGTKLGAIQITDAASNLVLISKVIFVDPTGLALGVSGNALKTDGSGTTQPVSLTSVPLPTGAATAGNQTNVQSNAGVASSVLMNIQGNSGGIPLPISATAATLSATVTQPTAANLQVAANAYAAGSPVTPANPLSTQMVIGGSVISLTNGLPAIPVVGTAAVSSANPMPVMTYGAGASAGAPYYDQLVNGGVAISPSNPLPSQLSQGNAAVSATNPLATYPTFGYTAAFSVSQNWTNTSTTVGAVPFSIFNPSSNTKTLYIKAIRVKSLYASVTAAATQIALGVFFFTGTAQPTSGTAITPSPKKSGYTTNATAQYAVAGLTVTSITKGTSIVTFSGSRGSAIQTTETWEWKSGDEINSPTIPPGSGIAIYYNTAGTATDALAIDIEWAER